jgi:hypothetical protein
MVFGLAMEAVHKLPAKVTSVISAVCEASWLTPIIDNSSIAQYG